ncbi:hypothetical protein [Aeromonas salmonicida]|uniref:hypothetical protein n=1 Tax=Aeromonas salmonicida TaxID=645 RepID=UPI003D19D089
MTEDQLEQEAMGWLAEVGYRIVCGYDMDNDSYGALCSDFRQVVLRDTLPPA